MPSPFPGMDPWLEDPHGWPGTHLWFIVALADTLVAALKPRFVVEIEGGSTSSEEPPDRRVVIRSWDEQVVTVIEHLTPLEKDPDRRQEYLARREGVLRSTAHLVEIDLLRAGERVPMARPLPPASYYVIVSRAQRRPQCEVYPIHLRDRLPTVGLPLLGDETLTVDLQTILDTVYDRAGYDAYLDHGRPLPPPPLDPDDEAWTREALARGPAR